MGRIYSELYASSLSHLIVLPYSKIRDWSGGIGKFSTARVHSWGVLRAVHRSTVQHFQMGEGSFLVSLVAGGLAGTAVDISLFPLDTIKTRLQSRQGFWAAGGFRRIYSGLGPAAVGSAPNAAVFFCTYDTVKRAAVGRGVADTASLHMAVSAARYSGAV